MIFFNVEEIVNLHRECIPRWKQSEIDFQEENFLRLVEENHAYNFQLWDTEDQARRDDLGFEFVYRAKRNIDKFNQQRNNRMEAIDAWLFKALQPATDPNCPVHSETPGMMIDRLSILALKSYHMKQQMERTDVDETHQQSCHQKWQTIEAQRNQLQTCLKQLFNDIQLQTRTFRVYHQFKMYNDPKFNPFITLA